MSGGLEDLAKGLRVRRMTPIECERLQGFPDDWTNIPYSKYRKAMKITDLAERDKAMREIALQVQGEPCDTPDSVRYKAMGNSWAVNVVRWIGERINMEVQK